LIEITEIGNHFAKLGIIPEVLAKEVCKLALLFVGPETFINKAVVDRVSVWVVPTTVLAGKREIVLEIVAAG
jgi:hypothetical protein